MATLLLQATGSLVGGFFGPAGAAIGSAVGSLGGYLIDQELFRPTQKQSASLQPRPTRFFSAEEGEHLPRVYGSVRISGSIIWMTEFVEKTYQQTRQGGKGRTNPPTTQASLTYSANVAFALCEGEIAGVRRVWCDGQEMDLQNCIMRVYTGSENQPVDPFIEAVQGSGNAPAYRGTAYVVFENLDLTPYGNRIPQLHFEVLRPVDGICKAIKAVALIPGSTEYGLSTNLVRKKTRPGEAYAVNRHVLFGATDLDSSLDELKMLCPNLENIALVITWYGNDLRASHCEIKPGVTDRQGNDYSQEWSVSGVSRSLAHEVSRYAGNPAFGGSPSDQSVIEAIQAIKKRGMKVTIYPFILMDIPEDNTKQDPWSEGKQPKYPWRGRITCDVAPGMPNSSDKTAEARLQIMAFFGQNLENNKLKIEWNYRKFILSLAKIAHDSGGVDAFLIGSELVGLTTVRDEKDSFPFVEALSMLAQEVRAILGEKTKITYGADWSEYFGYHPQDSSGDVFFHLDSLWANPAINAIGIDNYMPLSDWRDSDYNGKNNDGFQSPYDKQGLQRMISSGEGFDWFYSSYEKREKRERTEISDGAYGKPWVYRYKDLVSWWSNLHYERKGGIEKSSPTPWVPESKPIWFTEIGCPAIDKGPNQPNVFCDKKSSESAFPYFSDGSSCDLAAKHFWGAHLDHWNSSSEKQNPISKLFKKPMVDPERVYLWAWDARPFPAFPCYAKIWADSDNWSIGHWLNGRLSSVQVSELINAILVDHGLPLADVSLVSGNIVGYLVTTASTVRETLQPLTDLFAIHAHEFAKGIVFSDRLTSLKAKKIEELVVEDQTPIIEVIRSPDHTFPTTAILSFYDPMRDFQTGTVRIKKSEAIGTRQKNLSFQGALEKKDAERLVHDWLRRVWMNREKIIFSVDGSQQDIAPGSLVSLEKFGYQGDLLVEQVEEGIKCRVIASKIFRRSNASTATPFEFRKQKTIDSGSAFVHFLDLPLMPGQTNPENQFCIAAWKKPWKVQIVYSSPETSGFQKKSIIERPSSCGILLEDLEPGHGSGRIDRGVIIKVELFNTEATSISLLQMLNGANAVAILSRNQEWEVIQFCHAEEIETDKWKLTGVLRGQSGTEDAMLSGAEKGAPFIFLNHSITPAGLHPEEAGLLLNWYVIDQGIDFSSHNHKFISMKSNFRSLRPLSPVHLRCYKKNKKGYEFTWVRRGRIHADSWEREDIPLGEDHEEYQITIENVNKKIVRSVSVFSSSWLYSFAECMDDFGESPKKIFVNVYQKGSGGAHGFPVTREFQFL